MAALEMEGGCYLGLVISVGWGLWLMQMHIASCPCNQPSCTGQRAMVVTIIHTWIAGPCGEALWMGFYTKSRYV